MSNGQKDIRKSGYQEEGYQESRVSDYWMLDAGFRLLPQNSSDTESTEKINHELTRMDTNFLDAD